MNNSWLATNKNGNSNIHEYSEKILSTEKSSAPIILSGALVNNAICEQKGT